MANEWFVLQFKTNAHNIAIKNLKRQGFETFLPMQDVSSQKASRFINNTKPLFPVYMFINFDRANTKWQKIRNTHGVSSLVFSNSTLKSIPTEIINSLMKRCDLSGKLLYNEELKKGDQVKVLDGPFANFIATIEKYETDQRIIILMDFMFRETKIHAPRGSLQSLSKNL